MARPRRAPGSSSRREPPVPWGTIFGTIGAVVGTLFALGLLWSLRRVLTLVTVAAFIAIVLNPLVTTLSARLHVRRGIATGLVYLAGTALFSGLAFLFVRPLYRGGAHLLTDLPGVVQRAEEGRGPVGQLVTRFHLQHFVQVNAPKLQQSLSHAGGPALAVARQVISGLAGLVTILVIAFLMLLEAPGLVDSILGILSDENEARVRAVAQDMGRAVTGYVAGNLATSFIAGGVVYVTLLVLGVPFAPVFGVWVALVDLLPLVGGLLAGVPTVAFALLHSVSAGVVTLIVFLVYQQIENHILNPVIMSKTVKLNPLWVILSVLVGADLGGVLGALLAIPVAGAIQVVARDIWQHRYGQRRLEQEAPPICPDPYADGPKAKDPETKDAEARDAETRDAEAEAS
jgi:predicted PurR-regulated permease PerM